MNTQTAIRCPHCRLNQWKRETCRRCKRSLAPVVSAAPVAVAAPAVDGIETARRVKLALAAEHRPILVRELTEITPVARAMGRIVCRLRKPLMSQRALAERAGISNTMVHMVEKGQINASVRVIGILAAQLGMTASELLRRAELEVPLLAAAETVRFGPQRVTAVAMAKEAA